jgi:hypothetical protein
MKKPQNILRLFAISVSLVAVGGLTASAQTLIYSDNFNTANGGLDSASLARRIGGLDAGLIEPHSGGSVAAISGNQLNFTLSGGATTSEMRFDNTGSSGGSAPNLFDWSAGAGGSAITAAGGFTVSFLWTAGDTTSGNWIFFTLGNGGDVSYSNLRIFDSATENGILFKNSGLEQIFNNGAGVAGGGSYTPAGVNHSVSITYSLTSWAAGSPVSMSAIVDGNAVGSTTFNLNGTAGQYFDIGTYGNSDNFIDNFTVTTVPEPSAWAMMLGGFSLLLVSCRARRT